VFLFVGFVKLIANENFPGRQ